MSKRKHHRPSHHPGKNAVHHSPNPLRLLAKIKTLARALLHPSPPPLSERWKYLPHILAMAFICRAAVALSGDFVLHPDEIMQYLEPAHRLAFGEGIVYWEYLYGARSWLVPGIVAVLLMMFDAVGLGEPVYYIAGVKLFFCAISLLIPLGMYLFARRHFNEATAIVALLLGAFWYELIGFAHKPMTEFVAAALLLPMLALTVRPLKSNPNSNDTPPPPALFWLAAFLGIAASAIRVQYAMLALVFLLIMFLRADRKGRIHLAASSVMFFFAVGLFDYLTWGGWFHSYAVNVLANLQLGKFRQGETPTYQFLLWMTLASGGLFPFFIFLALRDFRRYGFLLGLIIVVLLAHSTQAHKEYRFIFIAAPLWILIAADILGRFAEESKNSKGFIKVAVVVGATASLLGIFNALPFQGLVYEAFSRESGKVNFLRGQDPVFAAYRHLASDDSVAAVWQIDRPYFNTPGYYYLHRRIPFYDVSAQIAPFELNARASHIVTATQDDFSKFGFVRGRQFGEIQIWRSENDDAEIRQWKKFTPLVAGGIFSQFAGRAIKTPPPLIKWLRESAGVRLFGPRPADDKFGIVFADEDD